MQIDDATRRNVKIARSVTGDGSAKPHVKFCGVWKAGTVYARGTRRRIRAGSGSPGSHRANHRDFVGWQLAVKRGSL